MMLPPSRVSLPGKVNLALYHCLRTLVWQMLSGAYGPLREALQLPSIPWRGPYHLRDPRCHRVMYGFSPTLLPPSPYWPPSVRVVGNWFLDEAPGWRPPVALANFLASGAPPVYVGFGSMRDADSPAFTRCVLAAIRQAGQRAVVATGWGGLVAEVADNEGVFVTEAIPHDWLFPRVAMAIHHGGVGTSAAALRWGVPSVVVPFFGDQPFWGGRLHHLGVAPPPLPRKRLDADKLAEAIVYNLNERVVARASMLGRQMRAEDGVASGIAQLREWGLIPNAQPSGAGYSVAAGILNP